MNFIRFTLAALIMALGLPVMAQVDPTTLTTATTNTFTIGGSSSTNVSALGRPLYVPQGKGVGISATYTGASSIYTTGVVALVFAPSIDGTNYATQTASLLTHQVTPNGATAVITFTNFPSAVLDNARYLKLVSITNAMTATNMSATLSVSVGRR